jgi:DNA-directed RNA polymerase specialized sigma24 family protein
MPPSIAHRQPGAKMGFIHRTRLYRIASGKVVDLLRKRREQLADSQDVRNVVDPALSPDELWEQHWKYEHLKYCVETVRGSVSEPNYQAFRMLLFEDCPVNEVCVRLGINANQVYKAKSRVLQRVREVLSELEHGAQT